MCLALMIATLVTQTKRVAGMTLNAVPCAKEFLGQFDHSFGYPGVVRRYRTGAMPGQFSSSSA